MARTSIIRPLAILVFIASIAGAGVVHAHAYYMVHLTSQAIDTSRTSDATGYLDGHFGDPNDNDDRPRCGDRMRFRLSLKDLEGEAVSLSFRIGGTGGAVYRRIEATARSVEMDEVACELIDLAEDGGNCEYETDIFFVVETTKYPDGEIGGQVLQVFGAPTFDATWGSVKRLYKELP